MTSFNTFGARDRDLQDGMLEKHTIMKGSREYVSGGGSTITTEGDDTTDQEVIVINSGFDFNVASAEHEVLVVSVGSDTDNKHAFLSLPHDKQRQWADNTGGVQSPLDPANAIEFNAKRTHATEKNFAIGDGAIEVIGGTIYLRGNVSIAGDLSISGNLTVSGTMNTNVPVGPGPVVVPGFVA